MEILAAFSTTESPCYILKTCGFPAVSPVLLSFAQSKFKVLQQGKLGMIRIPFTTVMVQSQALEPFWRKRMRLRGQVHRFRPHRALKMIQRAHPVLPVLEVLLQANVSTHLVFSVLNPLCINLEVRSRRVELTAGVRLLFWFTSPPSLNIFLCSSNSCYEPVSRNITIIRFWNICVQVTLTCLKTMLSLCGIPAQISQHLIEVEFLLEMLGPFKLVDISKYSSISLIEANHQRIVAEHRRTLFHSISLIPAARQTALWNPLNLMRKAQSLSALFTEVQCCPYMVSKSSVEETRKGRHLKLLLKSTLELMSWWYSTDSHHLTLSASGRKRAFCIYLPHGAVRLGLNQDFEIHFEEYLDNNANLFYYHLNRASNKSRCIYPIIVSAVWLAKSFASAIYLPSNSEPEDVCKATLSENGDGILAWDAHRQISTMYASDSENRRLNSEVGNQCFAIEGHIIVPPEPFLSSLRSL